VGTANAAENGKAACSITVDEDSERYLPSDIKDDWPEPRALDQLVGRNSTSIAGLHVSC
jgi:hypothetical protein